MKLVMEWRIATLVMDWTLASARIPTEGVRGWRKETPPSPPSSAKPQRCLAMLGIKFPLDRGVREKRTQKLPRVANLQLFWLPPYVMIPSSTGALKLGSLAEWSIA